MDKGSADKVKQLLQKGVVIPNPQAVLIGDDVKTDRIAGDNVTIYPGCRIFGEKTLIMPGAALGCEGPVTLENCQVGPKASLKGGFFRNATFLEKAGMGCGAHVRDGCILEEEASGAHTVGLKQTILFPFVTLGSLINFCDCLMAGGTSKRDHSEVGSSYIHFNYTPNQDKATPSLIGDVPRGVMLDRRPIFLGGQGGLVGPLRIEFGTVIAAGIIRRKSVTEEGKLILSEDAVDRNVNHHPGLYWQVKRLVVNNVHYIGNLVALRQWYLLVRSPFFEGHPLGQALFEGALEKLDMAVRERVQRLKALSRKMPESARQFRSLLKAGEGNGLLTQKQAFHDRWDQVEGALLGSLDAPGESSLREPFLAEIERSIKERGKDYVAVIQGLDRSWSVKGTAWLQGIVDGIEGQVLGILPSFK